MCCEHPQCVYKNGRNVYKNYKMCVQSVKVSEKIHLQICRSSHQLCMGLRLLLRLRLRLRLVLSMLSSSNVTRGSLAVETELSPALGVSPLRVDFKFDFLEDTLNSLFLRSLSELELELELRDLLELDDPELDDDELELEGLRRRRDRDRPCSFFLCFLDFLRSFSSSSFCNLILFCSARRDFNFSRSSSDL